MHNGFKLTELNFSQSNTIRSGTYRTQCNVLGTFKSNISTTRLQMGEVNAAAKSLPFLSIIEREKLKVDFHKEYSFTWICLQSNYIIITIREVFADLL